MIKKTIIIIAIIALSNPIYSQTNGTLVGGLNYSTARYSDISTGFILGWFAGFQFSMKLDENYYLKAFPQITQIGTSFKIDSIKGVDRLNYLKLPIRIHQKIPLKNFSIFFEGGPYFSISAGGKEKIEGYKEQAIQAGGDVFPLSPIDFGLGVACGIEIKSIQLSTGFDIGVVDIHKSSKFQVYNRSAYFSIGLIW